MSNVEDILSSDALILDHHKRHEARPGLWMLTFPGELMPDGHSFQYQHKGQLTAADLRNFCTAVRNEYAKRAGKKAEESNEAASRQPSSDSADRDPKQRRGATVSAPQAVPNVEIQLEAIIEAQVARLRDQVIATETEIGELGVKLVGLQQELESAETALEAYRAKKNSATTKGTRRKRGRPKGSSTRKRQAHNEAAGSD